MNTPQAVCRNIGGVQKDRIPHSPEWRDVHPQSGRMPNGAIRGRTEVIFPVARTPRLWLDEVMKILVVYCHPSPTSFNGQILAAVDQALLGHSVTVLDLYAEKFDPVMSAEEWQNYMAGGAPNRTLHARHIDLLQRADALVFIFPTWFYGPPAVLKGWLERVWLPEVAFTVPETANGRIAGRLHNIRHCVVITTSGSPRWWLWWVRNPARNLFRRGLKGLFHPKCALRWFQLYRMDHVNDRDRARFLARIKRGLSTL